MVKRGTLHNELMVQAAAAALYFVAGWLSLRIGITGQVTPIWFATGVGSFIVYSFGTRYLIGLMIGAALVSASTGGPWAFWISSAFGNGAEAFIAATLLRRWNFDPALGRVSDVLVFFRAALPGALFSAFMGTGSLHGARVVEVAELPTIFGVWALGNFMGTLLLTPALFTFSVRPLPFASEGLPAWSERVGLSLVLLAITGFVFGGVIPKEGTLYAQAFLLFPPVLWAALRVGPRGAALAALTVSVLAICGTAVGRGPFAEQIAIEGVVVLQFFLAVLVTTSLLLAASFAERQAAGAQRVLSERLASVGLLAAGLGHEIKNPLAFVMLSLDAASRDLARAGPEVTRAREALADARHGAERIAGIARSLKLLSREAAEERTPMRLEALVPLTLPLVRHELCGRMRIETSFGPSPAVMGNEARLGQVLLNLVLNAIQAIPPEREGTILIHTGEDGEGRAFLEVHDDGVGIAPAHVRRLFEPFFTTRPPGVGTGLGLYVSKEIIREHGGRVHVQSTVGEGTTIRITLPRAPIQPAVREQSSLPLDPEPVRAPCPQAPAAASRSRVLIVDDEVRLGTSMRMLLEPQHDVSALTCGEAALSRLLGGERYDVVLCDLQMPGLTGMDVYTRLRRDAPEQAERVVFLTGGAWSPEAQAFVADVPNPVLEKPVPPEKLLAAVERMAR